MPPTPGMEDYIERIYLLFEDKGTQECLILRKH
jgi:hypothetical protein